MTIVPDLTTEHTAEGSPIQAPGVQMWELKRVHALNATNQLTGESTGPNALYKPTQARPVQNAANRRAAQIPREYESKARKTDERNGHRGTTPVLNALKQMPQVKGLAIGAFGEFSDSINQLIKGMAYEGAIKNAAKFGQTNQESAHSVITWWLKRRWNRLALITAVQTRYDAMRYVGGRAQYQAAQTHERQQREDDFQYAQFREHRDQEAGHDHW